MEREIHSLGLKKKKKKKEEERGRGKRRRRKKKIIKHGDIGTIHADANGP